MGMTPAAPVQLASPWTARPTAINQPLAVVPWWPYLVSQRCDVPLPPQALELHADSLQCCQPFAQRCLLAAALHHTSSKRGVCRPSAAGCHCWHKRVRPHVADKLVKDELLLLQQPRHKGLQGTQTAASERSRRAAPELGSIWCKLCHRYGCGAFCLSEHHSEHSPFTTMTACNTCDITMHHLHSKVCCVQSIVLQPLQHVGLHDLEAALYCNSPMLQRTLQ